MKRNDEKDPGFDDIIFRDRNKEYGAYDLRRRYGSTMRISIVAGLIFGASLVVVPFLTADREQILPGTKIQIPYEPIKFVDEKPVDQPPEAPKLPKNLNNAAIFIPPVIVEKVTEGSVTLATAEEGLENPSDLVPKDAGVTEGGLIAIISEEEPPFINPEEMPSFPGGETEMMKFIYSNIVYPADAIANGIQGTVILRFVVSPTGKVTKIQLLRSINPLLDNEAIRILSVMPSWRPGKQNGRPVPVYFTVPVTFKLNSY